MLDRLKEVLATDVRLLLPGREERVRAECEAIGEEVERQAREATNNWCGPGGRLESVYRAQIGVGKKREEAELAKYGLGLKPNNPQTAPANEPPPI